MDSASLQFVLFGLSVALASNLGRSRAWRSTVLLIASVVFIALLAKSGLVLLPLAGFLLLGYVGIIIIGHRRSESAVWSITAIIILAYIWLKQYTFLPSAVFISAPYLTLGLSYIFFRVLHILFEARDTKGKRPIGLGAYLLYTINFTTFLSGPIQRYDEFAQEQFAIEPIPLGPRVIGLQLERIIRGLFKINVLAMLFDMVRRDSLAQLSQPLPFALILLATFKVVVAYPFFLYSNFAGYIDIVIALARLIRVRLPENFDRPFSASSFIEFWNRWHITLSSWFKTYVYNPLLVAQMRRTSSLRLQSVLAIECFFVTFFLVGVWHGRTSEFLFYGLLQGAGVAINKLWQLGLSSALGRKRFKALAGNSLYIALGRGLTFSWLALSCVWFWADWIQIGRMVAAVGASGSLAVLILVWLFAAIVLSGWEWLRALLLSPRTADGPLLTNRYVRVVYASALGLIALVTVVLLSQPAPGIVYKAF